MGGHRSARGLASFLEAEVVVAEPVLGAEGVKFVGLGHGLRLLDLVVLVR